MNLVDTEYFLSFSLSTTSIFQKSSRFLVVVVENSVLCEVQTEINTIENNFFFRTVNKGQVRDTSSYCAVISLFISTDRHGLEEVGSAQFEYCSIWDWIYVCGHPCAYGHVQSSPVEIQTSKHSNLLRHSMTVSPPVLSPNSILAPTSSHFAFIPERSSKAPVSKKCLFLFFRLLKSEIASVGECLRFVVKKSASFTLGNRNNEYKLIVMKYGRYFIQISDRAVCCNLSSDLLTVVQ